MFEVPIFGVGELPYERSESTTTGRRAPQIGSHLCNKKQLRIGTSNIASANLTLSRPLRWASDPPAKKPYGEGADEQIGRAGQKGYCIRPCCYATSVSCPFRIGAHAIATCIPIPSLVRSDEAFPKKWSANAMALRFCLIRGCRLCADTDQVQILVFDELPMALC